MGKKWATLVPMSLFTFLTSMSSAIMAPALHNIQEDLHFSSSTRSVISLSVYMLGMAIVPLFTAPLSEVFGRMIILQVTDIFFIILNTLCGIARTPNQLIGLRFLAGLGGAEAITVRITSAHRVSSSNGLVLTAKDGRWLHLRPI